MALQGTIETFPVTDVLQLLSSAGHTGRLQVEGDRSGAHLWVREGLLLGGEVDGRAQLDPALLVLEVLRNDRGVFVFESVAVEAAAVGAAPPVPLDEAVAQALVRLAEWRAIEEVVPTMAHRLRLSGALPVEEVTLDRPRWALVVAASRWPAVAEAAAELGMDDLTACRMAVQMVGQGLLVVEEPVDTAAGWNLADVVDEPLDATSAGAGPVVVDATVVSERPAEAGFQEAGAPAPRSPEPHDAAVTVDLAEGATAAPAAATGAPGPAAAAAAELLDELRAPGTGNGFPDHFPIDDLIGGAAPEWGAVEDPVAPATTGPFAEPAAPAGMTFSGLPDPGAPAPSGDGVDADLLRQMSHLSPQAAEAVAAALDDLGDTGPR